MQQPQSANNELISTLTGITESFERLVNQLPEDNRPYYFSMDAYKNARHLISAPASPVEERPEETAEELFDKYSEYIEDNSDSFGMVAGTSVVTRQQFKKCIVEILSKPSPVIEIGEQEDERPECWDGTCRAGDGDKGITSCLDCGGELRQVGSFWYHHSSFDNRGELVDGAQVQDHVRPASHPAPALIVGEREEESMEKWIIDEAERMYEEGENQQDFINGMKHMEEYRQSMSAARGWKMKYEAAREQLTSARTLILNIKRGNIYQEPADECDKWLNQNPEIK